MAQQQATEEDTRLEFFEAMRDFRKMFPNIEDAVIEAVLRTNNGAVDDTIDQLLVMSLDKDDAPAYGETVPKRIGDLDTASPRVDITHGQQSAHHGRPNTSAGPLQQASANASSNSASIPSYWLVDVEDNYRNTSGQARPPLDTSTIRPRKKIYRPPLVGTLPRDFLRISSSADPWEDSSTASANKRTAYSSRRSTDFDYRHCDDDKSQLDEGPPPSYAVAVGRRYSERSTTTMKVDSHHKAQYKSPQHTYLGVFRTTTSSHPPSPRRSSDHLAPNADALREAMEENEWKRKVAHDPELAQYLEDERIAIMLQNEEFMHHLQNDRDFLAALEQDAAEASRRQTTRNSSSNQQRHQRERLPSPPPLNETVATSSAHNYDYGLPETTPTDPFPYTKTLPKDDTVERGFHEKLALMGRASKQKFATMARRFIHKNKGAKGMLDNNESRTHAFLLDSDRESDDEERAGGRVADGGYDQQSDTDYNIGHRRDLKHGRFF